MAPRNSYAKYKRNTRVLVHWVVNQSNAVIKALRLDKDHGLSVNTTGEITVLGLVPLAELIAKHVTPIPSAVFRLLQSVIRARTATNEIFRQIVANNPDPEIEKSNASHRYFIDALTKVFQCLGGDTWMSDRNQTRNDPDKEEVEEDREQITFVNKFASLDIGRSKTETDADSSSDSDVASRSTAHGPQHQQRSKAPSKGKPGKRGKKAKKRNQVTKARSRDDVPLESCRIIEDQVGHAADDLMAVYQLAEEWIDARSSVQDFWGEVAYNGLNSAVAGGMTNIAISGVKRSELAMFIDFPGRESYDAVMKTIMGGNPDTVPVLIRVEAACPETRRIVELRMKEQFSFYASRDLQDFVTDFQKTRSGKPTKRMLKEIGDWDPNFDLQRATSVERISWRRSYTINWLYDMVNVFCRTVLQGQQPLKTEKPLYERLDWSLQGTWSRHGKRFGLNEFASEIASFVMQKPGTDVRRRILPHHVFQPQCIVDSMTVSRGWSTSFLRGHVLEPPNEDFTPKRDVDQFLGEKVEGGIRGWLYWLGSLKAIFKADSTVHEHHHAMLEYLERHFEDWLGQSDYQRGLSECIPPSRFTKSNANGLWEYSPFLCGIGLMDALELAYGMGLWTMDQRPEGMLLLHLQNMLVQKGYMTQPFAVYAGLENLFPTAFFVDGKAPTSDFDHALLARLSGWSPRWARPRHRRDSAPTADLHSLCDPNANVLFRTKSLLQLLREAEWDPERIPNSKVCPYSRLGTVRMSLAKDAIDTTTGRMPWDDCDMIGRAKAAGISQDEIAELSAGMEHIKRRISPVELSSHQDIGSYHRSRSSEPRLKHLKRRYCDLTGTESLYMLKWDILEEVCGQGLLSLNFAKLGIDLLDAFLYLEEALEHAKNPLYLEVCKRSIGLQRKRVDLVTSAMRGEDEACLRIMAKELQNPSGWKHKNIYWKDMEDMETNWRKEAGRYAGREPDTCPLQ